MDQWSRHAAAVQRAIVARGPMADTIFPIPIRPDVTVRIQGLPFDLTPAEAAKIAAVILAYGGDRGNQYISAKSVITDLADPDTVSLPIRIAEAAQKSATHPREPHC